MKTTRLIKTVFNKNFWSDQEPIKATFYITYHCNLNCKHCHRPNKSVEELTTKQVYGLLDNLQQMGVAAINFSGGEPLLRDDIFELLKYAQKIGLYTSLTTNGILLEDKMAILRFVDIIFISLDGIRESHNALRGFGNFEKTIKIITALKTIKIRKNITFTLGKNNIQDIDTVLYIAKENNFKLIVQPLELQQGNIFTKNNRLSNQIYSDVFEKLLYPKKNKIIASSKEYLAYLLKCFSEKESEHIPCLAGKKYFSIQPNGRLASCCRKLDNNKNKNDNFDITNLSSELRKLPDMTKCQSCLGPGFIEANLFFNKSFTGKLLFLGNNNFIRKK